MTVLSTLRFYTTLKNERQHCWFNAAHNLIVYNNFGKELHWVVGSLIFVADRKNGLSAGWGQNENHNLRDTDLGDMVENYDDSHAWLEDDEGNVYDYVHTTDVPPFPPHRRPDWKIEPGFINGVPRKVLARMGYELQPFKEVAQKVLGAVLIAKRVRGNDAVRTFELRTALGNVEDAVADVPITFKVK
jgi:hypothetical protein